MQTLLRILNYYRKFIESFLQIAVSLTILTKKDSKFIFRINYKKAFKELKRCLTTALILAIYNSEKEIILETDASDYIIRACLIQKGNDDKLRPIAYYSRKIIGLELNYDIYNKELLTIVEAFKTWRVYLKGLLQPVQVYTDYKNLLYWTTKDLNKRQVR